MMQPEALAGRNTEAERAAKLRELRHSAEVCQPEGGKKL
jgi:hypothetical protein